MSDDKKKTSDDLTDDVCESTTCHCHGEAHKEEHKKEHKEEHVLDGGCDTHHGDCECKHDGCHHCREEDAYSHKEDTHCHDGGCHCHDGGCHCHDESQEVSVFEVVKYVLGGILAVASFVGFLHIYIRVALAAVLYLVFGIGVWREMIVGFSKKQFFTEFSLMCLATVGAVILGEFADAAAVMYLYSLGEMISGQAYRRSRKNIAALIEVTPEKVSVVRDGAVSIVKPHDVEIGEVIIVSAGERIALDGVVVSGGGSADTSSMTGESIPSELYPGVECISGSLLSSGAVGIRVTVLYENSVALGLKKAVEEASRKKAKAEKKITAFAKVFTPLAFFVAVLVFAIGAVVTWDVLRWARIALVILVCSCPCSLVLSVPLSYFAGIGSAASRGIVFRGGEVIDRMKQISAVVFDKTGTLTDAEITYEGAIVARGIDEKKFLDVCYSALVHSSHVAARAFCKACKQKVKYKVTDVKILAGRGVVCKINGVEGLFGNIALLGERGISVLTPSENTVIYAAFGGSYIGRLEFASRVKSETASEIAKMRSLGVGRIAMMSGDTKAAVERAANEAGIAEVYYQLTPAEKLENFNRVYDEEHAKGSAVVAFCGDGMNDSAAIARADVGIAMGSGAAITIESADVVITDNSLTKISRAVIYARRISAIANQNIAISLAIKIAAVLFGLLVMPSMEIAIIADVGAAVLTVLNAMRAGKI